MKTTMQWDPDTFERELRNCAYFRNQSFHFVSREVRKTGTWLEFYVFRLDNPATDRTIDITFSPSHAPGKPAVSNVFLVKTSTDAAFELSDYIKQHHGVDVSDDRFRYTSYTGTFEERVRAFLAFATDLLKKYAEPTLQRLEWPHVEFDWKGVK